jgi:transposase
MILSRWRVRSKRLAGILRWCWKPSMVGIGRLMCLQACGARVHLVHPLGVKGFAYRRVKNDVRDASDLADLLRMHRLPEAWIAPPHVRELVRYTGKLVALRSGLKAQVHAVLAIEGVAVALAELFGLAGLALIEQAHLSAVYRLRVLSLLELSTPLAARLSCAGS